MATTKTQRWVILIILAATVIGTIGSFAVMILATNNQNAEAEKKQKLMNEYQANVKAYQLKQEAQGDELSKQYYEAFRPYIDNVAAFDRDSVTALVTNDLVVGSGEEISDTTQFAAYYIGWNPKGKVFDQSIDVEKMKLKAPLYSNVGLENGLVKASLIAGWKEGMKGMRIGGVREITIPSDKAYGETGQGDDIPANTPLKFIVMAIAPPAVIDPPQVPAELYQGLGY
ncbi:MAG: FKBP-type peptidyl-prolyl cis-trans isomerase [Candidatus Saccharimonas sp.]